MLFAMTLLSKKGKTENECALDSMTSGIFSAVIPMLAFAFDFQVQAPYSRESSGRSNTGLYESTGNDFQHVRPYDEGKFSPCSFSKQSGPWRHVGIIFKATSAKTFFKLPVLHQNLG